MEKSFQKVSLDPDNKNFFFHLTTQSFNCDPPPVETSVYSTGVLLAICMELHSKTIHMKYMKDTFLVTQPDNHKTFYI